MVARVICIVGLLLLALMVLMVGAMWGNVLIAVALFAVGAFV